jgi:hypothetical protein
VEYHQAIHAKVVGEMAQDFRDAMLPKKQGSHSEGLRILEIEGGDGNLAGQILRIAPPQSISRYFVRNRLGLMNDRLVASIQKRSVPAIVGLAKKMNGEGYNAAICAQGPFKYFKSGGDEYLLFGTEENSADRVTRAKDYLHTLAAATSTLAIASLKEEDCDTCETPLDGPAGPGTLRATHFFEQRGLSFPSKVAPSTPLKETIIIENGTRGEIARSERFWYPFPLDLLLDGSGLQDWGQRSDRFMILSGEV